MSEPSLLSTAYQFIRQGDVKTAERLLAGLIRQEPRDEYAWLLLAACKRMPEEKEKCLEFVVEINPANQAALQALGETLAGREADELILHAFEDWLTLGSPAVETLAEESPPVQIPAQTEENTAPPSSNADAAPAAVAVELPEKPRRIRTVWLWLAIGLLAGGQVLSLLRILALEQALVAAQVRIQSLQTILTEYIVRIELLEQLVH
jgi:hypothetical protein